MPRASTHFRGPLRVNPRAPSSQRGIGPQGYAPSLLGDRDRLSSPLSTIRDHYRIVVVGSGYGASIAASRLARAGQSVALLERGRELHPGEYPRSTETATERLQLDLSDGQVGDPRNLYAFHVSEDMSVFSGCGLGGTSLVNANVALRPEPWVLDDERWPAALRHDRDGLNRGYEAARGDAATGAVPRRLPAAGQDRGARAVR